MSEVLATVWDDVNCRGVPRLISVGGIASRTSGSAFSVATPLFPNGSGKLIPCDGTETAVRRFSGFSVTASAAPDDTVSKLVTELVVSRYKPKPESTALLSIVLSIVIRGVVFWLYSKL